MVAIPSSNSPPFTRATPWSPSTPRAQIGALRTLGLLAGAAGELDGVAVVAGALQVAGGDQPLRGRLAGEAVRGEGVGRDAPGGERALAVALELVDRGQPRARRRRAHGRRPRTAVPPPPRAARAPPRPARPRAPRSARGARAPRSAPRRVRPRATGRAPGARDAPRPGRRGRPRARRPPAPASRAHAVRRGPRASARPPRPDRRRAPRAPRPASRWSERRRSQGTSS